MQSLLREKFRAKFGLDPEFIARAPGRIEVIGNHTDYNGGTVLGAAIDRGVWVALARRNDGRRNFATDQSDAITRVGAEKIAKLSGAGSWVNYPLGILAALPGFGRRAPAGFDYLAVSDLPAGAGLSSSAAIELASALVFLAAVGETVPPDALVKIGRHAENHFVGVPCGILDQGTSGFGRKNHLVLIDCRVPSFATVPLPPGAHFWIFNTHTKHALVDGLYGARHRECMTAAGLLGVPQLVNATVPAVLAAEPTLPPPVFRRARHVVEEIDRVGRAVVALHAGDLAALGRLLTASHRSSQSLFENSTPELDFLVETLAAAPQVLGARLTGGGFGGAVMALTSDGFQGDHAAAVAAAYAKKFGAPPEILHVQTGDGAQLLPA
jgi:galactokinase